MSTLQRYRYPVANRPDAFASMACDSLAAPDRTANRRPSHATSRVATFRVATFRVATSSAASPRLAANAVFLVALLAVTLTSGPRTMAQQQRPAGRFLEEMINVLIDSQGQLQAQRPAEAARTPRRGGDPRMRELRANLAGFAQSVSELVAILYRDVDRIPGVRALLGDALQVNAQATLLARMSAERDDSDGEMLRGFQQVDQQWRMVSFRLRQLRYLTQPVRTQIDRVDDFHNRVSQSLNVQPQADREAVVRQATGLSTDLTRLLEEVQIDVTDQRLRRDLLLEGRQVYQQSRRVASLASESSSLAEVQREYSRFTTLWNPLAGRLRSLQIPHVDRQMQRVQAADRALQAQLLLKPEVDRGELLYMTNLLKRDLDELMDGITLRQLTELPNGRDRVVGNAADFYAACDDFSACVRNGDSIEVMADLYDYLDDGWRQVATVLRDANTERSLQVYQQLERSITDIRDVLSIQPGNDRERVLQVTETLHSLADHLDEDLRAAIAARPNNYPADFRVEVLRVSDGFRNASGHLSQQFAQGTLPASRLRELTVEIAQRWENLLPMLNRFPNNSDREHFLRLRQQITPAVVDLQTMLTM